ncbi:DUF481 domain-containing protein [Massilia cavernae]|uniref:DUF481 domain-containing protein n=1 Tax=Massilia cavernae TaxID=2320864 RepID=A0A418Y8J0_9BURK|nr:DUF481 domain-containing protein [Massilia cavernae]RJG27658.1 DUF481 domain-containing protein [Massilia cavernae]
MKYFPLLALAAAVVHGGACAGDNAHASTWNTSAELGAITTSGNTAGTSVTGKIDARQELADWSNQYIAAGFFKEDEKRLSNGQTVTVKSAERLSLSAKAAYKLMEDGKKLFVLGTHVDDKFGAYTTYTTMAVGHGWGWDNATDKRIDLEVGPGYFSGTRANGEEEAGFTVRGAAAMRWRLSPSAQFSQTVSVERGTSNVHSIAEAALSTKINGTMQMKAAFAARNDTNVPMNKKNTDTQTSLTLVYSF